MIYTIRDLVWQTMLEEPETRKDDMLLFFHILQKKGFIVIWHDKEIRQMPRFETIRRTRQQIQEEGSFKAKQK